MTYNTFAPTENRNTNISNFILAQNVDIVCTQEDKELAKLSELYRAVSECGKGTSEQVQMYVHKKLVPHDSKCMQSHGRYAIMTSLNGSFNIVSLHLNGGCYFDTTILGNFKQAMDQKLALLELVIENTPDIICGDFNSVYSENKERLRQFLASQAQYFATFKELTEDDKEHIQELNCLPYDLLKKHNYSYANPRNDLELVTNGRGKTTVDGFWYNPNTVHVQNCFIVDKQGGKNWVSSTCEYSDHNPVVLECYIKPVTKVE